MSKELDAIRARAEAATLGPWRTWKDDDGRRGSAVETAWSHDTDGADTELITDWCSTPDAQFIAHAREDVPRLLAALDAVLAIHAEGGGVCDQCGFPYPCSTVAAITSALEAS